VEREVTAMFKNILLPVDLTDRHGRVLEMAAEFATQGGGTVTLLHVIEMPAGLTLEEDRAFYNRLERTARSHLDRLGKQLEQRRVGARTEIRYGNRAQETVAYATDTSADLILLTAPRLDPANPAVTLASMSYKLGILSPCSVLLVK
jgi:nucleotide-binding universal stress UspA family protein